jgi:hypothetical protein
MRLFGGLGNDTLPAVELLRLDGGLANKRTRSYNRDKTAHADLGALLQDKLEFVACKYALEQCNLHTWLASGLPFLCNLADNLIMPDTRQDDIIFAALVIENDDVVPCRHPKDAANLVGMVFTKQDLIASEIVF